MTYRILEIAILLFLAIALVALYTERPDIMSDIDSYLTILMGE